MPLLSSLVTPVCRHQILRFTTGIFLLLLLVFGMPVKAAIYTVINLNDSGPGSLRQAMLDARDNPGSDAIVFNTGDGIITLSSELPWIEEDLTIDGVGQRITVSGGNSVRIMEMDAGVITLKNLTLANGSADSGGAIWNSTTLTVINCTFTGNIGNRRGMNIGSGGAIQNNAGQLTVVNSTFFDNRASWGGGIYNESAAEANIINSTFSGNVATYTSNNGNNGGNSIFNSSGIRLPNGTVIVPAGTVNLQNTIMASTTGYNCSSNYRTSPPLTNHLVSGATVGINLSGKNLSTDTTTFDDNACAAHSTPNPNLIANANPGLLSLADNGGWTDTMALSDGSPAIDAADNGICAGAPNNRDQRGAIRPYGSSCDIGAYEYGAIAPDPVVGAAAAIPTLSEWALLMLSGLMGLSVIVTLRRRPPAN